MNHGFVKVAAAVPNVQVADCFYNITQIEKLMRKAADKGVQIMAFPELSVTGYTCLDLFQQDLLLNSAETALLQLAENTADLPLLAFVGAPLPSRKAKSLAWYRRLTCPTTKNSRKKDGLRHQTTWIMTSLRLATGSIRFRSR